METIVDESSYALSVVIVSVGDVPWADMRKFDDMIPKREFNNIQFVNFTKIKKRDSSELSKETSFALAALMEIPL
ncbi:hypothetical protein HID58_076138 [Brassica napus]|uniref:BnaC07g18250D protein n=2 Tax=Brassica napus TaxID=3708 RepID=A0A078IL87_BRANA|nr:hypothetical protein HID58_076138 [Brassica napus]CAF1990634.1 unnamed protein product [Brassica napus]CDY50776.1 BnaC07g18250D [Brassica napus]